MRKWMEIDGTVIALAKKQKGIDYELGVALLEAKRARVWEKIPFGSFDEYALRRCGWDGRELRERLRVARKCEEMPCFARALQDGEVFWSAVREVTRIAQPHNAEKWLAAAKKHTVRELEGRVATLRPGDDPDAQSDPALRMFAVRLDMNAEQYATTVGIFDEIKEYLGDVAMSDTDAALVALRFWAEQHGNAVPKAPYQIAIAERDGRAFVTARGEEIEIPAASLEKAECDAQIVSSDRPVRACRKLAPSKRRFVRVRAKGKCEAPGCRNRFGLEDHHLTLVSEGGDHDTDFIVVLCSAHHDRFHDGTLLIEGNHKIGLRFLHADGAPYGEALDPMRAQAFVDAFEALRRMGKKHGETQRVLAELRALDPDMKAGEIVRMALRRMAHVGRDVASEAISGLKNLGFPDAEARRVVEPLARRDASVEEILRLALKELGKAR